MIVAVSNLKINNQSTDTVVRITTQYPVFTWDYDVVDRVVVAGAAVDSVYANTISAFEIRVGTTTTSLGTNSYSGDIVETGVISNTIQSWRLRSSQTSRGNTYYGQVRLTDTENNVSDWETFSFRYNSLPIVTTAAISPAIPTPQDNLELSYTFTDADADIESGTKIWWFKNGVHERQFDDLETVDAEYLTNADVWMCQIFPGDGYETGLSYTTSVVTVTATAPVISNAAILPENATYNDPLYATYDFSSNTDRSVIRWYVNGSYVSDKDTRFVRLELEDGDEVYYTALANDDEGSAITWVTSPTIVVGAPDYVVEDLRINGDNEPLESTVNPAISWNVTGPTTEHSYTRIQIGTAIGASNILSELLNSSNTTYIVPDGVLNKGIDYYVSVAAGASASELGPTSSAHFRTNGSRWADNVSNSRGWTVETTLRVLSTSLASSSSASTSYHGIRIYDGTKYAEVRIYTDRVVFGNLTYSVDNTAFATYTVIGQGSDIKVYRNYILIINGTGLLLSTTTSKFIDFGAVGESTETLGEYRSFNYTTSGAYAPSSTEYLEMTFQTYVTAPGSIDCITEHDANVYYSASDTDESSSVFKISDTVEYDIIVPDRNASLKMNAIKASQNGIYSVFCHDNGLTHFASKPVREYDSALDFTISDDPTVSWKLYADEDSTYALSGTLQITTNQGKLYFSQKDKGSIWFDNVDGVRGWTVDFTLLVSEITDDRAGSTTDEPDGVGIYVNDGRYQENVMFFTDRIVCENSNLHISYDTTQMTDYVIVGKDRNLKIFGKRNNLLGSTYTLLGSSRLSKPATLEGNGQRPFVVEDASGNVHAVWADDGQQSKTIYYSFGLINTSGTTWSKPECITSSYDCANPVIAVDSDGILYVVFESLRSDGNDLVMVMRNNMGWGQPFIVDSAQYSSYSPRIAIDTDDNLHLVWEDHREILGGVMYRARSATTGIWSDATSLTERGVNALRPSVDVLGTDIYVSYTVKGTSGSSDIYATYYNGTEWRDSVQISTGGKDADYSDVVANGSVVYIVWHDNKTGGYQIYGRLLNTILGFNTSVEMLTNTVSSAMFPCAGARGGTGTYTGDIYVVYQSGGDIDTSDGWTKRDTTIASLVYDFGAGSWFSSNVGGGFDVDFISDDLRQCRRPRIAKDFAANAHIVYESDMATEDEEYLAYADIFTNIRDIVYDLTSAETYSYADTQLDLQISAQAERKEIRFGDYSDRYSGEITFKHFKFSTHEGVDPFSANLLWENTPINTAVVDNNGNAWIAASDGLSFYSYDENRLAKFSGGLFSDGNILDVAFDLNNIMYVVSDGNIYISHDHLNFYQAFTFVKSPKSIAFDPSNRLWVASDIGIYSIDTLSATQSVSREGTNTITTPSSSSSIVVDACEDNTALGYIYYSSLCGLPTDAVNRIYADSEGQVWATSTAGLILIRNGQIVVYNKSNSGLPSNDIKDIAIITSSTRYIATAGGLVRMSGSNFEKIVFYTTGWSDDVTAICWTSPNTLWMGAGGNVVQLERDPITADYSFAYYDASDYANLVICDNNQRFVFDALTDGVVKQVLVNNRLVENGYQISNSSLVFDSPLLSTDRVAIVVRNDITSMGTLVYNAAEMQSYGDIVRTMKKFVVGWTGMFGITTGGKHQVVMYDLGDHLMPYDSIVMDTTAPTGTLTLLEQIDRKTVRLQIADASDNLSGITQYAVANYPNITTDGDQPAEWQAFQETFEFDLGDNLGNVYTELEISGGSGNRLVDFGGTYYAGCSAAPLVYKYSNSSKAWVNVATIGTDSTASIEFLVVYRSTLYAGLSFATGGAMWASSDGQTWTKKVEYPGGALCATVLGNKIYIGTGGDSGGQLFSYDGVNSQLLADNVGSAIYAAHGAKTSVYVATGTPAILYRWDTVASRLVLLARNSDTAFSSVGSTQVSNVTTGNEDFYVFAGTAVLGRIIKSINSSPFTISMSSLPVEVTQIKTDLSGNLYALVGTNVYKYSNRAWTAVYTNAITVEDILVDSTGITIVDANSITRISSEKATKKIYLSLKDAAGNTSREPGTDAITGTTIVAEIDIEDLVGFTNANRLLELDEYGDRVWNLDGDSPFYSGDKVTTENAVYYSEIFNGTNDHVTWDIIYWDAVVPEGTDLNISVRTADTRDAILTTSFAKTFTKDEFEGGDISNLSGQYIQFKVTMSTTVRDTSPKLYAVNVKSRTRTAIHFFTTNFVLPSKLKGGILTAQTFVPVAADVIFGINTNDSTDFRDYQIIEPDRLFTSDETQTGTNLRVGIKLISPLRVATTTDPIEEYDAYAGAVWNNIMTFDFTNSGAAGTYFFEAELFEDYDLSGTAAATVYMGTTPEAFSVNGESVTSSGITIANGETVSVLVSLKGNAAIRCSQSYYVRVSAIVDDVSEIVDDLHAFVMSCRPNYVDTVALDFTNDTAGSGPFHFRVKVYADAIRTTLLKTYYSGLDQTGWYVDGVAIDPSGETITPGQMVTLDFTPPTGDLTEDDYFITIDYFDGTSFYSISQSPVLRITSVSSEYTCGEYTDVPVVKDVAIQFEIEDFTEQFGGRERARRTIQLNL